MNPKVILMIVIDEGDLQLTHLEYSQLHAGNPAAGAFIKYLYGGGGGGGGSCIFKAYRV